MICECIHDLIISPCSRDPLAKDYSDPT